VYEGATLPTQGTASTVPWSVITATLVGDDRGLAGGPPTAAPWRTAQPLANAATHPATTAMTAIRRIRHPPESVAPCVLKTRQGGLLLRQINSHCMQLTLNVSCIQC
jgi:hypothetical protein